MHTNNYQVDCAHRDVVVGVPKVPGGTGNTTKHEEAHSPFDIPATVILYGWGW